MNYQPQELISSEDIALRIKELGTQITRDYSGKEVVVICVLKGAFMFCSDLISEIDLPVILDFVSLSSYGDGKVSTGEVKMDLDLGTSVAGKEVIVVEDIVDTGLTLDFFLKHLNLKKPASVRVASFLKKPKDNSHIKIDYLGFEIEDKFVIGYGLDYAGRYRELPYVGFLNAGQ